jgi:hypothetical protein
MPACRVPCREFRKSIVLDTCIGTGCKPYVRFQGEANVNQQTKSAETVENDPKPTSRRQAGFLVVFDRLVCAHWGGRPGVGVGTCQGFTNR